MIPCRDGSNSTRLMGAVCASSPNWSCDKTYITSWCPRDSCEDAMNGTHPKVYSGVWSPKREMNWLFWFVHRCHQGHFKFSRTRAGIGPQTPEYTFSSSAFVRKRPNVALHLHQSNRVCEKKTQLVRYCLKTTCQSNFLWSKLRLLIEAPKSDFWSMPQKSDFWYIGKSRTFGDQKSDFWLVSKSFQNRQVLFYQHYRQQHGCCSYTRIRPFPIDALVLCTTAVHHSSW